MAIDTIDHVADDNGEASGNGETKEQKPGLISDLTQVAAAATAAIGVLTALAVSGVLGKAQRDHGSLLVASLSLVLSAAVLWAVAPLIAHVIEPPKPGDQPAGAPNDRLHRLHNWFVEHRVAIRTGLQILAVPLFVLGIIVGIVALVQTQGEGERPAVSATYDGAKRLLTGTVSAEGMGSDQRIVVLVRGVNEEPAKRRSNTLVLVPSTRWLYLSALGPDSDGKVAHTVTVYVPKRFSLVELKAWTGETETNCNSERAEIPKNIRPAEEVGCLVLRLPEETTTTTTTTTTESTGGR